MECFVIFFKVISSAVVNCSTVFSVDFLSVTEQLIIIIIIALLIGIDVVELLT